MLGESAALFMNKAPSKAFSVFFLSLWLSAILPLQAPALIQLHPHLSPTSLDPGHPSDSSGISHSFHSKLFLKSPVLREIQEEGKKKKKKPPFPCLKIFLSRSLFSPSVFLPLAFFLVLCNKPWENWVQSSCQETEDFKPDSSVVARIRINAGNTHNLITVDTSLVEMKSALC